LSKPEQIYETAEKVKREVGQVDILVSYYDICCLNLLI
jgi:all-trans-retinol dehydrogenase (NAD+)